MTKTLLKATAAAVALNADGGKTPPDEIMLIPAGTFATRAHDRRGPWTNDRPDAVIAATKALGLDLPIDYDHQTQRSETNGKEAPAAGWIKSVFARDGAIWGKVEWTEKATAMLRKKEYRFLSPVFMHTKAGKVQLLRGAALTNDPALSMPALASADDGADEHSSELAALALELGLPETSTVADIRAAVRRGEEDAREARCVATVDAAVEDGRITPANRDHALAMARLDLAAFTSFAEQLNPVIAAGALAGLGKKPERGVQSRLEGSELAICQRMGVKPEAFLESKKRLAGPDAAMAY